jgi:vacuolar iron transporter family protein
VRFTPAHAGRFVWVTETLERTELHPHRGDWLRDAVFGLNDGIVTTLVFILAVSNVASSHIVAVGIGEVIAGGVSMTLGGFLSARTEREVMARRLLTERDEIENEPDEERAELREIYAEKGLEGEVLDRVVADLTADDERWLRAMMQDEHGVSQDDPESPIGRGLGVGASFVVGGIVPIVPFAFHLHGAKWWAIALTALVALGLGALKSRYTPSGPLRGALEFVLIVGAGTVVGVGIGSLLQRF